MKLIDNIDHIEISDNNKFHLEDTISEYEKYISTILNFEQKLLEKYLLTIKSYEILNNQQAENENSFLISLYENMHRHNSLTNLINILNTRNELTKEDLIKLHRVLMRGTLNNENTASFRNTNTKFVGSFNEDGTKHIDYIPIDYFEIESSVISLINYLNTKIDTNPFIKPFIFHAILAVMQPFDDGNTRLSRLIQHGKIWTLTNDIYNQNFTSPIIYLSKNYLITRGKYRELIKNLAVNEDNASWNKWFNYNLDMVDEQLNYLNNNIKDLKLIL